MLSEARDRHVEDVLREDPERIRRGKRSRNDCPWPSPWESHLSAPSAAVEEHREYVTFFDRLSRDGLSRRTEPSRRANNAQVSGERCTGVAMSRGNDSRIVCYFDGSCPGNQFGGSKPMRAAFVVGDTKIVRQVPDLSTADGPIRSNNIAEYFGLIYLLQYLSDLDRTHGERGSYLICGDSELVIRQMRGEYRVKAAHLRGLRDEASRIAAGLEVEFREVPRERNPAGFLLE